jgi:glucokinase
MNALVGVDVGASRISGGLVTVDGDVVAVEQRATHARGQGTAVETVLDVIGATLATARARGVRVEGIGVGLPGAVDVAAGAMLDYPTNHVREFAGVPLRDRVAATTGLPAVVDNDANALALAEWTFGAARGASSLVLLAIGTEIGGAIMIGDTLVRGHSAFAGELGHVPIEFRGPRCICGGRGCAGVYLGGRVMAQIARRRVARARSKLVAMTGGDPRSITAELIFEAARLDDPLARSIVDRGAEALAALLAVIVNGINPEVVAITGGLAPSLEPLREDLLARAGRYAYALPLARTRLAIVDGDKGRTVRGGAALVLHALRSRDEKRPEPVVYNAETPEGGDHAEVRHRA